MKIAFAIIGPANAASTTEAGSAASTQAVEGGDATPTTHTGTHEEAKGVFPPFDPTFFASQLFWLVIIFGIFYLLMSRLAIPRVGAIIKTRQDRIQQDLDEAGRLKNESDAAHAAYEHELAEARNRAHSIGLKARDEAKAAIEAKRSRVEADLASKLGEAESRISAVKAKAMAQIGRIASETTAVILEELLGSGKIAGSADKKR